MELSITHFEVKELNSICYLRSFLIYILCHNSQAPKLYLGVNFILIGNTLSVY